MVNFKVRQADSVDRALVERVNPEFDMFLSQDSFLWCQRMKVYTIQWSMYRDVPEL